MTYTLQLQSGLQIGDAWHRLVRFCEEEYDYYDAIPSAAPNRVTPLDVLAIFSVNGFFTSSATNLRAIHRGLSKAVEPHLAHIPEDASLLTADSAFEQIRELLHDAVQVKRVLIPVATKVLHRKRRELIPMLDNVLLDYYLPIAKEREGWKQNPWALSQDKRYAADVAVSALRLFREDLCRAEPQVRELQKRLTQASPRVFELSVVRILELLIWVERQGQYRSDA